MGTHESAVGWVMWLAWAPHLWLECEVCAVLWD